MQAFATRLSELGRVEAFDYPYQIQGRRSPDRPETLLAAHRSAYERLRAEHPGSIVLIGKSMGSRIGCHLANQLDDDGPAALICLGYPLVASKGAIRDSVLLELKRPILFVQGSRDALCPLDRLASVRTRMSAPNELLVVQGGDHSLRVSARALASQGRTQPQVDGGIMAAIRSFLQAPERR